MRYLFTTSSDISDGVILTFDLKTRIIRVSCHRTEEPFFEEFPQRFDDFFAWNAGIDWTRWPSTILNSCMSLSML